MRFIPAYAGNARAAKLGRRPSAVHPRIRGERDHSHTFEGVSFGSSPHTRGTHTEAQLKAIHGRFIPAYAGNAAPTHSFCRSVPVHPRIRGERSATAHPVGRSCGSSPHTRGTLSGVALLRLQFRFIPAYAGNAIQKSSRRLPMTVHPRIRGERTRKTSLLPSLPGSSPHTRGTPEHPAGQPVPARFIPAYAGNAPRMPRRPTRSPVHPRIRGERQPRPSLATRSSGSSPHTRGTLVPGLVERDGDRFIPAYAGNAPAYPLTVEDGAVHPRIRGERSCMHHRPHAPCGSSPHTRGTRRPCSQSATSERFIPAYAGNA